MRETKNVNLKLMMMKVKTRCLGVFLSVLSRQLGGLDMVSSRSEQGVPTGIDWSVKKTSTSIQVGWPQASVTLEKHVSCQHQGDIMPTSKV